MNYRSYEWKIIYVFIVVFVLIQGGSFWVLMVNNERIAKQTAQKDLEVGTRVLGGLLQLRASQLQVTAQVLASDYGLREAISTGDRRTIESMLTNHGARIQAAAMLLTDMNGQVIAFVSSPLVATGRPIESVNPLLLQRNSREQMIAPLDRDGDTLYQIITLPVSSPLPIATLSIGFPVGDPSWLALGREANVDFSFFARTGTGPWSIHGSTYPAVVNEGLLNQFQSGLGNASTFASGEYEYLLMPLVLERTDGHEVIALAGKSLPAEMAPFEKLQSTLLRWVLMCFTLTMVAVFLLTRHMVGPLNTLAHLDTLTGLANRRLFDMTMKTLCDDSAELLYKSFAVLLLDLDEFKRINDQWGHDVGDKVLQETARRLKAGLRQSDLIARYGGDEFAILLRGANRDSVRQVVESLLPVLRKPLAIDDLEFPALVSIGIAMAPDDGRGSAELLRKADIAMYAAKHLKSTYAFYGEDMATVSA